MTRGNHEMIWVARAKVQAAIDAEVSAQMEKLPPDVRTPRIEEALRQNAWWEWRYPDEVEAYQRERGDRA